MISATATLQATITATAQLMAVQTGSCASATVKNSDNTYNQSIASGATYTLADTIYNVYVNGVLDQTTTQPSMIDLTINIT